MLVLNFDLTLTMQIPVAVGTVRFQVGVFHFLLKGEMKTMVEGTVPKE